MSTKSNSFHYAACSLGSIWARRSCCARRCFSFVVLSVRLFPSGIDPATAAILTRPANEEDLVWEESRRKCEEYFDASVDYDRKHGVAAAQHDGPSTNGFGSGSKRDSYEANVVDPPPGQPRPPRNRLAKRNPIVEENCNLHYRDGARDSRHWDVNAAGDPYIQGFARPFSVQYGTRNESSTVFFRLCSPRVCVLCSRCAVLVRLSLSRVELSSTTQT